MKELPGKVSNEKKIFRLLNVISFLLNIFYQIVVQYNDLKITNDIRLICLAVIVIPQFVAIVMITWNENKPPLLRTLWAIFAFVLLMINFLFFIFEGLARLIL